MVTRYTNLPDNKDKPFGGAYSVYDVETVEYKNNIIKDLSWQKRNPDDIRKEFLNTYMEWMPSTHNLIGIEKYTHACFTQGTTESFAQFYIRYRNKKLRLAEGEYFYHQMMHGLWYDNFAWLSEEEIKQGDVVLISVPFSDTGDVPSYLENLLNACDEKNVPVMIDLAYINIAKGLTINLEHPCIEYVVSSLSKIFPVEHHRIGIRLQRKMFEDQLYVVNENNYNYINLMSAHLGAKMMKEFSANYIYDKYRDAQDYYCSNYKVEVSPCVYFGIDKLNQYPTYNRGNDTNRLCFSRVWDGRMNE
tara:strand:+ start:943 stop:1854 length:912 start_codon:yes stop_codon:yes gene_type:complete